MRALLDRHGNPQDQLRNEHVAGSKGKGSTSAMLASILGRADYPTGLFTSPHLVNVEERIQVDGTPIARQELASLMEEICAASRVDNLEQSLTFFEIATALGFLYFARRRVELAVIEVGLGGRFDSTNVCRPLLSIITSISFDHTQVLGNTLAAIAMEKAGIVKPGRPCLSGVRAPEARAVIERVCQERRAPLRQVDVDYRYDHTPAFIDGYRQRPGRVLVTARHTWPAMEVGLMGEHQAGNAALAVAAVEELREQGLSIPDQAVAHGLANVPWPARLEIMGRRPLVLLDCAHNVASAEALVKALSSSLPPRIPGARRFLIFAGSRDKDLAGMLRVLAPAFDHLALTRFHPSPRGVTPEELARLLPPRTQADLFATAAVAWETIRNRAAPADLICVTGSVFLAGELRPLMEISQPWTILTARYGGDTRNPTDTQLAEAIAELYHEALPGMTEGDYAEHGAAFLRYGWDDGPMFVVAATRLREVTLEEWADQDFEQELAPARAMRDVSEDRMLQLWIWLAEGQIDRVRSQAWV
jgi:dihydrofolate synthase/folylpolyglutamate synthase